MADGRERARCESSWEKRKQEDGRGGSWARPGGRGAVVALDTGQARGRWRPSCLLFLAVGPLEAIVVAAQCWAHRSLLSKVTA